MRYKLSPSQSSIQITASSSVHPIEARATQCGGWLELSEPAGAFTSALKLTGELTVEASSLHAHNPLVSREMRRRIDPKKFPTIEGRATGVTAADGTSVSLDGEITFLGKAVAVSGDLLLVPSGTGVAVTGEGTLDVRAWGLTPPKLLMMKVHPDVNVAIALEFQPAR